VILDLGIDLATPAGRMFFHQLASFARTQSLFHWKPDFLRGCSMNIYEVAIRILPLFPDAQIAEDEDGQIVIMTGVKKADPPRPERLCLPQASDTSSRA